MLTPHEEQNFRMFLEMMKHDPYYYQMYRQLYNQQRMDGSNRLRDEMGRFLPNNYNLMDEYGFGKRGELRLDLADVTYDDEPPREIKLKKVEGSYGTYKIEEKEIKLMDLITFIGFISILIVAFIT
jgi:hypothetical protein